MVMDVRVYVCLHICISTYTHTYIRTGRKAMLLLGQPLMALIPPLVFPYCFDKGSVPLAYLGMIIFQIVMVRDIALVLVLY